MTSLFLAVPGETLPRCVMCGEKNELSGYSHLQIRMQYASAHTTENLTEKKCANWNGGGKEVSWGTNVN